MARTSSRCGSLPGIQCLDGPRQARLSPGSPVGVNHFASGRLVEFLNQDAKLGLAFFGILRSDGFTNLTQLGAERGLGGTIAGAADGILPHAFLGTGCIGHGSGVVRS